MPAPRSANAYAITANHLMTGDAVYYADMRNWQQTLDKAMIFQSEEQANQTLEEIQQTDTHLIAGAYIIGLDEGHQPLTYRERLRLSGPTNYRHGKQEMGA